MHIYMYLHVTTAHVPTCNYGTRKKKINNLYKFVCRILIINVPHFYGLSLNLCDKHGIWYCDTFCQTCCDF